MKRAPALWTAGLVVAALASPVQAEVTHDETSQQAFGFDELGGDVEGAPSLAVYEEAWERFANTVEGARILGKIDASRDFHVTVRVVPGEEIDSDVPVWGQASWLPTDDERQEAKIEIALDESRDADAIAETIYHEFRHVEHWIEDRSDGHDELHARTDPDFLRFLGQLTGPPSEEPSEEPSPAPAATPIYDSLFGQEPAILVRVVQALGDTLADGVDLSGSADAPTFHGFMDIEAVQTATIDATADDDFADFADAIAGAMQTLGIDPAPAVGGGEFIGLSIDLVEAVPLSGPDSLQYMIGIEADGDPANDASLFPSFDPVPGTDTSYGLMYDPVTGEWSFNAVRLGPGGLPDDSFSSGATAVIEGDKVTFLLPADEIGNRGDGFSVSALNGALDVLGGGPTDPLLDLGLLGITDPYDQVTILGVDGLTDPSGDLWLKLVPSAPWPPPAGDDVFSIALFAGLEIGERFHIASWSLHDGETYAEGQSDQDIVRVIWYTTPDGCIVVRVPGPSPTGGFPSELVPLGEPVVLTVGQMRAGDGEDLIGGVVESHVLEEINMVDDLFPRATWTEVVVDNEP